MKKKKILAQMLSLAMAATLTVGMGTTAFAAGDQTPDGSTNESGTVVGGMDNGASGAVDDGGYPGYTDGQFGTQLVDTELIKVTDGIQGTASDRGKIRIAGLEEGNANLTVTAYPIIEAQYDGTDNKFSGWHDLTDAGLIKDGKIDSDAFGQANLAKIAASLGKIGGIKLDAVADGTYGTDDAPAGSYLILVSGGETKTYGPMVVSVFYRDFNTLNGTILSLSANMAFAKMQDEPTIEKKIAWNDVIVPGFAQNNANNSASTNGNAVVIGPNEIMFDIRVNNIPEYHGSNTKFVVTDTMSKGLEYVGDVKFAVFYNVDGQYAENDGSIKENYLAPEGFGVEVAKDTDEDGRTVLTWDFSNVYADMLLPYAGHDMVIRYVAKVNPDELDFSNGIGHMENDAKIEFVHNSNVDGGDDSNETPDRNVYTFDLKALKVDAADVNKYLSGAEFTLTPVSGDAAADEGAAFKVISGENGTIEFKGLSAGEYVLKETKAPEGYTLDEREYKVVISASFKNEDQGQGEESVLDTFKVTIDDVEIDMGDAAELFQIKNTTMTDLPSTGGAGSALFIGIGAVGLLIGLFVIFGMRRKQDD